MALAMKERHAVVKEMARRYRKAGNKKRGNVLDELVQLTGYTRSYPIQAG
jgi:hypothetical protein